MKSDIKSVSDEEIESLVDTWIGDYRAVLEKKTFTDSGKTSHLDAIKYTAAIVWNSYKKHDEDASVDDVFPIVEAACLTMHTEKELTKKFLMGNAVDRAVSVIQKFKGLILLEDYSEREAQSWVKVATSDKMSESFIAQMVLVSWCLCLVSKMTGFKIPGVKNKNLMVGGRIMKEREEMVMYFTIITTITQAMSDKNNWNFSAQYSMLKQMQKDLCETMKKFRV